MNCLSSDRVKSVIVDSDGDLWVGTENGLNKLNYGTGEFIHYFHDPQNQNSISSNFITSICEDLNGNLWIGTWSGLDKFDKKTKTFTHFYRGSNFISGLVSNQIKKVSVIKKMKFGLVLTKVFKNMLKRKINLSFINPTN